MTRHAPAITPALAALCLLVLGGTAGAADELLVNVADDGSLTVTTPSAPSAVAPVKLELNGHGTGWQHVEQSAAEIPQRCRPTPTVRAFSGLLPIPGDRGGLVGFRSCIATEGKMLSAEWQMRPADDILLNGLQASIWLDAAAYKGSTLSLTDVKRRYESEQGPVYTDTEPVTVTLPLEPEAERFVVFDGYCGQIQVLTDKGIPFTITAPEPYRFIIQDNRQWEHDVFEVRLAFFMAQGGVVFSKEDALAARLLLEFGDEVKMAQ